MTKKQCWIFDLDGTLADKGDRNPYDESRVRFDTVIEPVQVVLRSLKAQGYPIIFVSGRTEGCRKDTIDWIKREVLFIHPIRMPFVKIDLHMRRIGDRRKDDIVKKEIYDKFIFPKYDILGVFDDRMQVCRMLYENNIFCFNVNQGLKEF